jgi:uncharacterized damage-inducible protein DinB
MRTRTRSLRTIAAVTVMSLLTVFCGRGTSQVATSEPLLKSIKGMHDNVKRFMLAAAEEFPDKEYTFQATPEVRSVAQIFMHVAYWQYFFCGQAKGEDPTRHPLLQAFQKNNERLQGMDVEPSKTNIVAALRASYDYCDGVFATLTPEQAGQVIRAPGFMNVNEAPRVHFLSYNVSHANEHYGNLVTYLRLKGHVPPSTQPR